MLRFTIIFLGVQIALALVWQQPQVYNAINLPLTQMVAISAYWLMHWFDADVARSGVIIYSAVAQKAVEIKNGCNGLEGAMVVFAAVVAYPSTWIQKIYGTLIGVLVVQILNLVRVISLYYLNIHNPVLFEWTHNYVWQMLIIIDAFVFFLIWTRWISSRLPKR